MRRRVSAAATVTLPERCGRDAECVYGTVKSCKILEIYTCAIAIDRKVTSLFLCKVCNGIRASEFDSRPAVPLSDVTTPGKLLTRV